jgi:hypothetical protein
MRRLGVRTIVLMLLSALPLRAQQPFYTDDAEVSDRGALRVELSNEFDLLQHSAFPGLKQNTLVYRFGYGLTSRIELGVDAPLIAILKASSVASRDAFGPGDTNFAVKYKVAEEHPGSRLPAFALRMNVEAPTGNVKDQLGSGLVDYWLYGALQKTMPKKTVLHVNLGVLFAGNGATGLIGIPTRGRAFTAGTSAIRRMRPKLKLGGEITAAIPNKLELRRGQLQVQVGGNLEIKKATSLDFGVVVGHFAVSPRFGLQVGFTTGWPKS